MLVPDLFNPTALSVWCVSEGVTVADLGFWKEGFILVDVRCRGLGAQPPAADKIFAFTRMQIQHNLAINMMTVDIALPLLKIPELWIQTIFKMIYCAKGN